MAFVAGPRQVGKTTLALALPRARDAYLNWDASAHRERILRGELPPGRLWVFDEIHKYRRWRNYLKGLYDGRPRGQKILVTGSGRLDLYRFGGDSLQGRYHLLRLHPFSAAELGMSRPALVARLPHAAGARGGRCAGAHPGPRAPRAADSAPARAGRLAALGQCAARGPAGEPQGGGQLDRCAGAPVRRIPAGAIRRAAHPRGEER